MALNASSDVPKVSSSDSKYFYDHALITKKGFPIFW